MGNTLLGTSKLRKNFIGESKVKKIYVGTDAVFTGAFAFSYTGTFEYNGTQYTNTSLEIEADAWYVRFLTSGTLTVTSGGDVYIHAISGGAAGTAGSASHVEGYGDDATGGTGGASGSHSLANIDIQETSYVITIGAGGSPNGGNGGNTSVTLNGTSICTASGSSHYIDTGGLGGVQNSDSSKCRNPAAGRTGISLYGTTYCSGGYGGVGFTEQSWGTQTPVPAGANGASNTGDGSVGGGAKYVYMPAPYYTFLYTASSNAGTGGSGIVIISNYES